MLNLLSKHFVVLLKILTQKPFIHLQPHHRSHPSTIHSLSLHLPPVPSQHTLFLYLSSLVSHCLLNLLILFSRSGTSAPPYLISFRLNNSAPGRGPTFLSASPKHFHIQQSPIFLAANRSHLAFRTEKKNANCIEKQFHTVGIICSVQLLTTKQFNWLAFVKTNKQTNIKAHFI